MRNKILAQRYGEAYVAACKEGSGFAKGVEDLKDLKLLLHGNTELEELLYNPEIAPKEKFGVFDRVLAACGSCIECRQLVRLLIEKGRVKSLIAICDYVWGHYAHGDAVEALLRTTYPMDLEVLERLKSGIEKRIAKKLNLYLELDPELAGGVQIRIGNTVIDGSVHRRLEELRDRLMKVQV